MRTLALLALAACSSPSPPSPPLARSLARDATFTDAVEERRWLAGDLHMHVSPPDARGDVALSITQIAEAAVQSGMDFVVLTPHVWGSRWLADRDAWRGRWKQLVERAGAIDRPTMIPGIEWTTREGHFTVVGIDLAVLEGNDLLEAARAAGAWISVNHPFAQPTQIPGVGASHYDLSYRVWSQRAPGFTSIDGVEVMNVPLALANLIRRPGGRTGEDRAWTEMNRVVHEERRKITAVAGTDNHHTNVSPTTWVLAVDATASSILAALRAGATCIGGPEAGSLRARGDAESVAIGGTVEGAATTLTWEGTARVFVDDVDHGEHAGGFTHQTGGALHTYRIAIAGSRSGFVYANL